jgi:hypothetical protein
MNESDLLVAWRFAKKRAGVEGKQTFHMLRDLLVTSFYRVGADVTTAQFLTGHGVDANQYLQIMKTPERPEREWKRFAEYLESGIDVQTLTEVHELRSDLTARDKRIEELERQVAKFNEWFEKMVHDAKETKEKEGQKIHGKRR